MIFGFVAAFPFEFDVVVSAWRYTSDSVSCFCVYVLCVRFISLPLTQFCSLSCSPFRAVSLLSISPFKPRFLCLTRHSTSDFLSISPLSVPSIVSIPHHPLAYFHLLTTTIRTFNSFAFACFIFFIKVAFGSLRIIPLTLPHLPGVSSPLKVPSEHRLE